jgi:glyoxylase-like metal-dependent hydrolase (beta-lactamase superfamily II)
VAGVLITNANHRRAATNFSEDFAAPIFAHPVTCATCELRAARNATDSEQLSEDLRVIEIQGAAAGEIALYHDGDGGAIIMGDALINFEPYGFSFLPPKYCSDAKEMHRSLRQLLDYNFERMLFAHGAPLIVSARDRLEQLFKNRG